MQKIMVLVISLPSSQPRRERMKSLLQSREIQFEFIDAVDGRAMAPDFAASMNLRPDSSLSAPEVGCTLSHVLAWKRLIEAGSSAALILEDDVHCRPELSDLCQNGQVPEDVLGVFRLETLLATVTADCTPSHILSGVPFNRIYSNHGGSAAYLINQLTARFLIQQVGRILAPIDTELFDPDRRNIEALDVFQAIPAVCIQDMLHPKADREPALATTIPARSTLFFSKKGRKERLLGKLKNVFRPLYLLGLNTFSMPRTRQRIRIGYRD